MHGWENLTRVFFYEVTTLTPRLVSIQKWPFSEISASICGIVCAAYDLYASAQSLDFLDFAKNCSFLNWKLELMPIVGDFHFRMGAISIQPLAFSKSTLITMCSLMAHC
jgi:hypothetical protein